MIQIFPWWLLPHANILPSVQTASYENVIKCLVYLRTFRSLPQLNSHLVFFKF